MRLKVLGFLLLAGCSSESQVKDLRIQELERETANLRQQLEAQRKYSPQPTPASAQASIQGEISVITKTQDVKPVRNATIHFFKLPLSAEDRQWVDNLKSQLALAQAGQVMTSAVFQAKTLLRDLPTYLAQRSTFHIETDIDGKFSKSDAP